MIIGEPIDIDLADVSVNLSENEAPAWSASKVYGFGETVVYNHHVYSCILKDLSGQNPELTTGYAWALKETTNAFKAFDGVLSNPSVSSGSLQFTISDISDVAAVAIFDVNCEQFKIDLYDGLNQWLSSEVVDVSGFNYTSFYDFLFTQPSSATSNQIFTDIPAITEKVRLTAIGSGYVAIGEIKILGRLHDIGWALMDSATEAEITSYSKYQDNDFGVPEFRYLPARVNSQFKVHSPKEYFEEFWSVLKPIVGRQLAYWGSLERPTTIGFGILRSISLPESLPDDYIYKIDFEGVQ